MSTLLGAAILHTLFTLDVRVLDAVEGGPLILEATLTYTGSLSEQQVEGWLKQLDAPRFADREKATEQLLAHFGQARSRLEMAAAGSLSPEAASRVNRILRQGSAIKRDPLEQQFMSWLNPSTPADRRVLTILAAGAPGSPIVNEAKAKLNPSK